MVNISKREEELPGATIAKFLKIAEESKDIISLGPGEPDFDTPKPIIDYAKKILAKATHYSPTEGRIEFREAIVKKLKKENKIKCNPENIIVTCGSQEAIFIALAATVDVAEEVIVPNPGFLAYIPCVELLSAFPIPLQLKEEEEFDINFSRLHRLIDNKTKAIIINSPSNPLGSIISRKTLEALADVVIENDLIVFSDEAYEKFVYDDAKHVSIASLNGMFDYTITFHSFSKSYAMPGFRIGYAAAPEKLIKAMTKIHPYITLAAPTVSQMAATFALSLPKKHVEDMKREYDRRRKFIWKRLNEIGMPTVRPKGAFYAFSNIQEYGLSSAEFSEHMLKKAKVAMIPGTEFGLFGEGFIRCSYATALPKIEEAMKRVGAELENLKRKPEPKKGFFRRVSRR